MTRVVKLNEGQLRRLVRRMLNESAMDDGYKLYVLPKRDADLDEIVEYIGLHRQESGTMWPVLANGGNRYRAPGEPFDGYYAVGFQDPADVKEFRAEIRYLAKDHFTEDEVGERQDYQADASFERQWGPDRRRQF
jgi:hypothetical protein